jgi:hypothetical protein
MDDPRPAENSVLDELTILADELLEQASAVRRQWAELNEALGVDAPIVEPDPVDEAVPEEVVADATLADTTPEVVKDAAADAETDTAEASNGASAAPPPAEPAPAEPAPAEPAPADPIRLVALDMMLSGRSREETHAYLTATFGEEIDIAVVDEIFSGGPA